ncbi:MAG TPA: ABC transporter ATP-binding protein [Pyrinomonadaceae bacterium]|nr:ABC transporter ATP-binding protein [Pyrinomonadaceae bacterium]
MKDSLESGVLIPESKEQAAPHEARSEDLGLKREDSRLKSSGDGLVVVDVRKSYRTPGGHVEVLRGASLAVRAGESVAILGASGAGKSTLLHVCGGLDAADAGEVAAFGFDLTKATREELTGWRGGAVGFVFQFHHLLAELTALENVALPLLVARRARGESMAAARRALDSVGLAARAGHLPGELSGGEQQRVAVARAVVRPPSLVLADEPTGNLDAAAGEEVGALLVRLAHERGAAVIVATHNERLARLCGRALVLSGGVLREHEF